MEEVAVAPEHLVDEVLAEETPGRGAMLVPDLALRREQHLPAALPCPQRQVEVLEVERVEHHVEPAEGLPLALVERARSAAAPEDGYTRRRIRRHGVMAVLERSLPEARAREACLLADLGSRRKEDLARDGEDVVIVEGREERGEEVRLDSHVGVEYEHDVVAGVRHAGVVSPREKIV